LPAVFLVAGLFADQHDPGSLRAFAEHGLGRTLPERTGAAIGGLLAEGVEAAVGHAGCRCHGIFCLAIANGDGRA